MQMAPGASPNAKLPFELKLVGPNIWAAIGTPNGGADGNAGFLMGDDGALVIDSFENEAAAKALINEIHRITATWARQQMFRSLGHTYLTCMLW
jgi:hypothetical protein